MIFIVHQAGFQSLSFLTWLPKYIETGRMRKNEWTLQDSQVSRSGFRLDHMTPILRYSEKQKSNIIKTGAREGAYEVEPGFMSSLVLWTEPDIWYTTCWISLTSMRNAKQFSSRDCLYGPVSERVCSAAQNRHSFATAWLDAIVYWIR